MIREYDKSRPARLRVVALQRINMNEAAPAEGTERRFRFFKLPERKVIMLTFGFIVLVIAGILGLLGFGVISSPVVGPARVAFYFLLGLSFVILIYGTFQQRTFVEQSVPIQEQE